MDGLGSVDVAGGSGSGHGVGPGGGGWLRGLAHQGHTLALTGDGQVRARGGEWLLNALNIFYDCSCVIIVLITF